MPIRDIRQFIDWCVQGDSTLADRLAMFRRQKSIVEQQISQLQKHMEKINHKIRYYEIACEAGTEDAVRGIPCDEL